LAGGAGIVIIRTKEMIFLYSSFTYVGYEIFRRESFVTRTRIS